MLRRLMRFLSLTTLVASPVWAGEVQVAVAANFAGTLKNLAADFTARTGHKVVPISGATGKFYAQIRNGAPFEVFLSADDETPAKLEKEGLAVAGSRFTYAVGQLVLWSAKPDGVDRQGAVLRQGQFAHLAMANPKLAPYGQAAEETLRALGVYPALQSKIVMGENITQAYQYVYTGNAELGLVAKSQVYEAGKLRSGSAWEVPASLHSPIRQDAVLLEKGRNNPAAHALLQYLRSEPAKSLIGHAGYGI